MAELTIKQLFDLAIQHHRAGRLAEAEEIYRHTLAQQPEHSDANHLLGVIVHQKGQNDLAVELIRKAIAIRPDFPEAYSNLGLVLQGLGQLDDAIAAYRKAIALNPNLVQGHSNLGNALKSIGKTDEAIAVYRNVVALRPDIAEACNSLGLALVDKEQFDEAIDAFRRAISLKPTFAQAHNNLGSALNDSGQLVEAIACYQKAVSLEPGNTEVRVNLIGASATKAKLDKAIDNYRAQAAYVPDLSDARFSLGNVTNDSREQNLVMGMAWNLSLADVRIFVASLRRHYPGDVMMLVTSQGSEALVTYLRANGVTPIFFDAPIWMRIHVQLGRYVGYAQALRGIGKEYEHILLTDVSDVVFQGDPFVKLPDGALLCFLEAAGRTIGQCPDNSRWIKQIYGLDQFEKMRNYEISCSGTTIGTHWEMIHYLDLIMEHAKPALFSRRKKIQYGHDQGIHNFLLREGALPKARLIRNGEHIYTVGCVSESEIDLGPEGTILRPAGVFARLFINIITMPRHGIMSGWPMPRRRRECLWTRMI